MKKILSVLLSVVMVVAMSSVAMAGTPQTTIKLHYNPGNRDIGVFAYFGDRSKFVTEEERQNYANSDFYRVVEMDRVGNHFEALDNNEYVSDTLIMFKIGEADVFWDYLDVEFKPEGQGTLNVWLDLDVALYYVDIYYADEDADGGTASWTGDHAYFWAANMTTDAALTFDLESGYRFVSIIDTVDEVQVDAVSPLYDYPDTTYYTIEDIDSDHILYVDTEAVPYYVNVDVIPDGEATPEGMGIATFTKEDGPRTITFETVNDYDYNIVSIDRTNGGVTERIFSGETDEYSDTPEMMYTDIDYVVTLEFDEHPFIHLEKSVDPESITDIEDVDQNVTYSFVISIPDELPDKGNVGFADVYLVDPTINLFESLGALGLTDEPLEFEVDWPIDGLDPGLYENTAAVYGFVDIALRGPNDSLTDSDAMDDDDAEFRLNDPSLVITKSVSESTIDVREMVDYEISVTNEGNITFEDVVVTDDKIEGGWSSGTFSLEPNETKTFPIVNQYFTHPGTFDNTATVTVDLGDYEIINDSNEVSVTVVAEPEIQVVKTVVDGMPDGDVIDAIGVGGTFYYRFDIDNVGDMDLTDIQIKDTMLWGDEWMDLDALAEEVLLLTYEGDGSSYSLYSEEQMFTEPGDLHNEVEVRGIPTDGQWEGAYVHDGHDGEVYAEITIFTSPAISLVKEVSNTAVNLGDTVTYSFTIENTGDVPLEDILLEDPMFPGWSYTLDMLAVGEVVEVTDPLLFTLASATGSVENTATVSAIEDVAPLDNEYVPRGRDLINDEDSATFNVNDPRLSVEKVALDNPSLIPDGSGIPEGFEGIDEVAVGDPFYYMITVTNVGDEDLMGIVLTDPMFPDMIIEPFDLVAGDFQNFLIPRYEPLVYNYPIILRNTAAANGMDQQEEPIGSSSEEVIVEVVAEPSILLTKSASPSEVPVGETATYTFRIENTGDMPLKDVMLEDPMFPDLADEVILNMDPGDVRTITRYRAFEEEATITNEAMVTAVPYYGLSYVSEEMVSSEDDAVVDVLAYGIDIQKTVDDSSVVPNESVTYFFRIVNTGDIDYPSVLFSDELLGIVDRQLIAEGDVLAVGEAIEFSETSSFSSEGNKTNTAMVKAFDYVLGDDVEPDEPVATDQDSVTVRVNRRSNPSTREYTLILEVVGGGRFTITANDYYERDYKEDSLVDVSYVADSGWEFDRFATGSDDEDILSNGKIRMDEDKYLRIVFVREETERLPEPEPEILDEPVPEAAPVEEEILDDILPETGGVPLGVQVFFGGVMAAFGLWTKHKKD